MHPCVYGDVTDTRGESRDLRARARVTGIYAGILRLSDAPAIDPSRGEKPRTNEEISNTRNARNGKNRFFDRLAMNRRNSRNVTPFSRRAAATPHCPGQRSSPKAGVLQVNDEQH